jgi:hypothetical protein
VPVRPVVAFAVTMFLLAGCSREENSSGLPAYESSAASGPVPTETSPGAVRPGPAEAEGAVTVAEPENLDPDQQAVVDAYRAYVASLDRLVRTNDPAASGVQATATGEQLDRLQEYTDESVRLERISDGPPLRARVLSVTLAGPTARLPVCLDQSFWVDVVAGAPTPVPAPLAYFDVTMQREGGHWLASEAVAGDSAKCAG